MKTRLLLSFVVMLAMLLVMRFQGQQLVTPVSPLGILDLEFARTAMRLKELQLFWNTDAVLNNIYLDFIFIAAYTFWFRTAVEWMHARWYSTMKVLAVYAAIFDVCENVLMYMAYTGRTAASVLEPAFYCAVVKFALAAVITCYLLITIPFKIFRPARAAR
jgi:hypothetical protein